MKKILLVFLIIALLIACASLSAANNRETSGKNELGTPFPTLENVVIDGLILRETAAAAEEANP